MLKSKLIDVIRTFSSEDISNFAGFLYSSHVSSAKDIYQFYQILLNFGPEFNHLSLEKKRFYQLIFPGKPYNEKKMWYLMSDLLQLCEDFIIHQKFMKDNIRRNQYLLEYYNEKGLSKHFSHTVRVIDMEVNTVAKSFTDQQYAGYRLFAEADKHFGITEQRRYDDSLQKKSDHLDRYYFAEKLKDCCEMLNRSIITGVSYDIGPEEMLLESSEKYESEPYIAAYRRIFMTLRYPEQESQYQELKSLLRSHGFPKKETLEMYDYLQNYCIRQANQGNSKYLAELFESYEYLFEKQYLPDGDHLSQWIYKNVVHLGLRLGRYEWTEEFINEYRKSIAKPFRKSAYIYNQASWYFYKQDYRRVLKMLRDMEFSDPTYKTESQLMLLKTYYELREVEPMFSLLDSFKNNIRRNKKITGYKKDSYRNFNKMLRKVFKVRMHIGKKTPQQIAKEIQECNPLADKVWLLEKAGELE